MTKPSQSIFQLAVIVAALGFFVDTYDLLLFSIIRKPSLASIGLHGIDIRTKGELLLSVQMIGMIIGGVIFGIIGDRKGRLRVLFGSILLYSLANFANGLVTNIDQYLVLRFIAGVGLAGELGAGVTLVSEQLPANKRSMAAGFIAGFGLFGVVVASIVSKNVDWRWCYHIGGAMGILLLLLRIQVQESGLYKEISHANVSKGNFLMFFNNRKRLGKYLQCILIGLPVWYIIGILVSFADEFGKQFNIPGVEPGTAIMYLYLAIAAGDFSVGYLSHRLKSRKKTLFIFYTITIIFTILYFLHPLHTATGFYLICAGLGYGAGFNVVYITMGVEQFGTNLRASAAISIPNMVRGALPLSLAIFGFTRELLHSYVKGAIITGVILFVAGLIAAWFMDETYGRDLEFTEV